MRGDNRSLDELRPVSITPEVIRHAEGSVDISMGHTRLICTASVEPQVPKWLQGTGEGWVTAEYGMLPRSTHSRIRRDKAMSGGRTQEISRLIGRSLRAAVDLKALGERQISIDCDVVQADGGTRTAAVTGGFIALALALRFLQNQGDLKLLPLKNYLAAVSVGLQGNDILLDLNYEEDFSCGADSNFVANDVGEFVEIQITAEGQNMNRMQTEKMMDLAMEGCQKLFVEQEKIIGGFFPLKR